MKTFFERQAHRRMKKLEYREKIALKKRQIRNRETLANQMVELDKERNLEATGLSMLGELKRG
jgi:hypothetical protein